LKLTTSAALASFAIAAPAQLHKPTVHPEVGPFDDHLRMHMSNVQPYTLQPWNKTTQDGFVSICVDCKKKFEEKKFALEDNIMFNVTYVDCGEPWVMCRHKDAAWK
jgi:hypothetical protein